MSWISIVAIAIYAFAALLCARASLAAGNVKRLKPDRYSWAGCSAFFMALIIVRVIDLENRIRDSLRMHFRQGGLYDDRWQMQAILASCILVIGAAILAVFLRGWFRRTPSRRQILANLGVLAMFGFVSLFALRLTSLHAIDALLYGPLKLNWVIDLSLTVLAAGAAVFYTTHIRDREAP